MVLGPATFVVLFAAGVLLVVGAFILGGSRHARSGRRCSACDQQNVRGAAFCARCGKPLDR